MLPCFKPTLVYEFVSEELCSHEPAVFSRFIHFRPLLGVPVIRALGWCCLDGAEALLRVPTSKVSRYGVSGLRRLDALLDDASQYLG